MVVGWVLAPPDLISPRNFEPLISEDPREETIHFEWKPVSEAISYNLRISTTAMFTKIVKEVANSKGRLAWASSATTVTVQPAAPDTIASQPFSLARGAGQGAPLARPGMLQPAFLERRPQTHFAGP